MTNGKTPSSDEIRYGAKEISIRKSTLSDSPHALMVQKALNYIDENVCRQHWRIFGLLQRNKGSRRGGALRFRKAKCTIIDDGKEVLKSPL